MLPQNSRYNVVSSSIFGKNKERSSHNISMIRQVGSSDRRRRTLPMIKMASMNFIGANVHSFATLVELIIL